MANVVRQDVIQLGFDVDNSILKKVISDLDALKKSVAGVDDNDGLKKATDSANKLGNEAKKAQTPLSNIGKTSTEKLNTGLDKVKTNLSEIGKKASVAAYNGLKKVASVSFKAITAGLAAAATGVGALVKNAVSSFADYEQLIGGVETLFKDSAGIVENYANNAYKTAGLSANDYMETVTGFSASLLQSVGGDTKKAAEYANTAITDMSDNANKMGTSMESIQYAYQGFAKQNYTMLDNLKLGYGGTQEEMKRLIQDAAKIDKSIKANDTSYANIVQAIHVMQQEMGIAGTTSKEASSTIQGSLSSLKSSWGNLMTSLVVGGDSFDQCVDNLVESALTFGSNIMPALEKALAGMGTLIEKLAPVIEKEFPKIVDKLLPPLLTAATALVKGLIKALPDIIKVVIKELPDIVKQIGDAIVEAFSGKSGIVTKIGEALKGNAGTIAKWIPYLLGILGVVKIAKSMSGVWGSLSGIFGKKSDSSKNATGKMNLFSALAKTNTKTVLKGMANLAIILGGLAILATAFMLVAPKLAELSDVKSIAKVLLVMGALGLLGAGIAKLAGNIGDIPVATVAKGLANIAIVIGGMSALYLVIGACSLIDFELSKMAKVIAVIGLLGIVGAAIATLAGFVGAIPVAVVALGLANMAIVITGMSALFLLIGAVSFLNFDLSKIMKITLLLGLLGAVGSAATIFAGIAGIIPMPVVLAGLANIALVLGGLTAIILAFGQLSETPGFADFLTKGGEVLQTLFNILGKIAGSLIGGLGEGISESLPKIGENLAKFGENIKPLFSAIQGVDMAALGAFFTSLVGLLGIVTGNEIIEGIKSFFGGGEESALEKLGKQLSNFATNAEEFFTKVATFPAVGFENAKLLFQSLADIGNVPKSGGIKQWFGGETDFDLLAAGLKVLSGEEVTGFYSTVANVPIAGFESAKLLFQSLADIGNIPKTGGVKQWFGGETDYNTLANGLKKLSSDDVIGFFTKVSSIPKAGFNNAKALFKSLAEIADLPKTGGIAQWFSGETNLADLGADLKQFGEDTADFFQKVNNLNLANLNGLWDSLKRPEEITTDVLKAVSDNIEEIVDKVTELPKQMADGIESSGESLKESLVSIWVEAAKAMAGPVNKIVEGANHILKEFDSDKVIATWTPYANGTNGHKGGNALVNDGRGAELVQMPNGKTFIPQGKNVFIPNAPKGMKVLPAEQTAGLMGKKTPTFHYANGTGDLDIWSYIDNTDGLVEQIKKSVSYEGLSGFALDASKSMVATITSQMSGWVKKQFDEFGAKSIGSYVASAGVEQWRSTVIQALKMTGQYSEANVKRTLYQMQTESGGNPMAINLWDSNAKKGIPSKGLMQCIDPTFKAYAFPGYSSNIYDPLSNILASIRYAVSRYGSLARAYQGHGYANGGIATKPSIFGEDGAEMAIPLSSGKRKRALGLWQQTGDMLGVNLPAYSPESSGTTINNHNETNNYSPVFNLTLNGSNNDRETQRKVKRWIQEAMNEMFDSMSRKTAVRQV